MTREQIVMNDDDLENTLASLFSSEQSPSLSEAFVDTFLASNAEAPVECGERVMILFVRKVLSNVCEEPVKEVGELPFGRLIESIRRSARLSVSDIAAAIGKEPVHIERLESSRSWPWEWEPNEIAHLLLLFRLHIKATGHLVQTSFSLSKASLSGNVIGRANKGRMTRERGDSTSRALDMFLARKAKPQELDATVKEWLSQVEKQLKRYKAHELLD
jgi:hypothetical protein